MSVGLYMDVHVPAAITRALVLRGVDVLTSQLDGTMELDDASLLDRATALGRVLFSQDSDLLAEAALRQRNGRASLLQGLESNDSCSDYRGAMTFHQTDQAISVTPRTCSTYLAYGRIH